MSRKDEIDFSVDSEVILIIATHSSSSVLVKTLRKNHYSGAIILVEDKSRPLTHLSENSLSDRLVIDPVSINEIIPLIASFRSPLGCVVSWYNILDKQFINAFNGRLLNIHTGDLPNYRGAGGGSWQILNGQQKIVSHVQQMIWEVDRGPLLFGESEMLPHTAYPRDVKAAGVNATERVLKRLGEAIANKEVVELLPQDEQNASYFPRLSTHKNGWVDFSWHVDDVERFIRAFSHPYEGASFYYMGTTYRVKECWKRKYSIDFNPFCHGLLINKDPQSLHVACNGGVVCLAQIFDEHGNAVDLNRFKLGRNISPDVKTLRDAKT